MNLVYLVDDNQDFTKMFKINNSDKWTIKTFNNPVDALKEIHIDNPKVVISDIYMPNVHGLAFHHILKITNKNMNIVHISGNSIDQIKSDIGDLPNEDLFFRKPLKENFYKKITEILATEPTQKNNSLDPNYIEVSLKRYKSIAETSIKWNIEAKNKYGDNVDDWPNPGLRDIYKTNIANLEMCKFVLGLDDKMNDELLKKWGLYFSKGNK